MTSHLAPGDLPKPAPSFDLPVALGVLAGSGQLISDRLEHDAVVGELALEGHTRPVKRALSMAIATAKQQGVRGLVVPTENANEAAVVEQIEQFSTYDVDFGDVRGQEMAKRAIMLAAAGAHNLIML